MDFRYVGTPSNAARVTRAAGVASKVAEFLQDRVIQAHGRNAFAAEAEWRSVLREMSEEARAARVPAEQLLVEIKQALRILYDTCDVPYGPERVEFTNRIVTLCIEEYYSSAT